MRTDIIIPTKWTWLALLLMIGFNGFIAQVRVHFSVQKSYLECDPYLLGADDDGSPTPSGRPVYHGGVYTGTSLCSGLNPRN